MGVILEDEPWWPTLLKLLCSVSVVMLGGGRGNSNKSEACVHVNGMLSWPQDLMVGEQAAHVAQARRLGGEGRVDGGGEAAKGMVCTAVGVARDEAAVRGDDVKEGGRWRRVLDKLLQRARQGAGRGGGWDDLLSLRSTK